MDPKSISVPPRDNDLSEPARSIQASRPEQQEAAANIVRSQIESLYSGSSNPQPKQSDTPTNPYDRTHTASPQPDMKQWEQYHSAWQNYYQKYYEGYYTHHFNKAKEQVKSQPDSVNYFSHQPAGESEEQLTKDEALLDLRQKLLSSVKDSAQKVRKSRHFLPIFSAVLVMLVFGFLQYNQIIMANVMAYVSPGTIDPKNILLEPTGDISVSPEPRLIIPKINVDVPVNYDVGNDYDSQMAAMRHGLAHFSIPGANSHPGEIGNTAIAGHSSADLFSANEYKFIFVQLDKLVEGDSIYANYNGKRYTYIVTGKEIVKPDDVGKLTYTTDKPVMTLITCTPVGTSTNRLLVTAEQISPDPTQSKPAVTTTTEDSTESIPGTPPSFFEKLFSGNWD